MRSAEYAEILRNEFPEKKVALVPPENPTMAICEVEWSEDRSVAIAYIERLEPHYHNGEVKFGVEKGEISLLVVSRQFTLTEGEERIVQPRKIHSVSGDWARVRIELTPGWTKEDHIPISRR